MKRISRSMPVSATRQVAGLSGQADRSCGFKARLSGAIILAILSSPLSAANCTPDSITLSSQSEVDNFQANHGPCDTIVKMLSISGADISDLSPLSGITKGEINSDIMIQNNPSLSNLDGLSGLTSFHILWIFDNPALTSISGLSNLGSDSGALLIEGNTSLTNLTGLEGVTSLYGALILGGNQNLSDLSALSNLTSVGASLAIMNSGSLTTLDDLSALEHVGSYIGINDNNALTSISGLSGVSGFSGWLSITGNPVLGSLEGLSGITSLEGLRIRSNPYITNVDNLSGVTAVGSVYSTLEIDNNALLENLDGLAALVSLDADLEVIDNPKLSRCAGLAALLDEVDDALPGPGPGVAGIPDINGDVLLSGNLGGCNSVEEILETTPSPPNGANFIAGEAEFLLKGSGLTRGCLPSMIRLPGPVTSQSRDLLLKCAMQDYAEDEILVFRASDKSCSTLRARNAEPIAYELPVHAPQTPYSGSLEEVSEALFLEHESAFLVLNLRTRELIHAGSLDCGSPGLELPDVIFVDSFE